MLIDQGVAKILDDLGVLGHRSPSIGSGRGASSSRGDVSHVPQRNSLQRKHFAPLGLGIKAKPLMDAAQPFGREENTVLIIAPR